jgi:hypothetical protein
MAAKTRPARRQGSLRACARPERGYASAVVDRDLPSLLSLFRSRNLTSSLFLRLISFPFVLPWKRFPGGRPDLSVLFPMYCSFIESFPHHSASL